MFGKKRALAPEALRTATEPHGRSRRAPLQGGGERGAALLELAFAVPVLMILVTGIFSFGLYLEQDMMLTDAVNVAGKNLAIQRGNTTDPCSVVYNLVTSSAPQLASGSMSFSYSFNGNPYSGTSCSSTSTSTGAAGNLVQGQPITITVHYPCDLSTAFVNLVSGCQITSEITEMVQ